MNANTLSGAISRVLVAGEVPLILGRPGIGKTDIVHQVADANGWDCLTVYPAISLPEHFQGFPFRDEKSGEADFAPLGWLKTVVNAKKTLVVFLDEIDKASQTVQSVCAQLVLGRTVGTYKVPDCVLFALAANRPEDRAGGTRLVTQLEDRCARFTLEVDVESWLDWAERSGVRADIRAFISRRPERLDDFDPARKGRNSSCRSWTKLGRHLDSAQSADLLDSVGVEEVAAYVSEVGSTEYVQFRDLLLTFPSYEEIVGNPDGVKVPERADAAYAVASMVVFRAVKASAEEACRYLIRFNPEIVAYALKALAKRGPEFIRNKSFLNWAKTAGIKIVS